MTRKAQELKQSLLKNIYEIEDVIADKKGEIELPSIENFLKKEQIQINKKEKMKEYNKTYYKRNKEKKKKYCKEYYKRNKEKRKGNHDDR